MKKQELIDYLVDTYQEDKNELKNMKKYELEEILENYEDHSDMFPNNDEFDGSHEWDQKQLNNNNKRKGIWRIIIQIPFLM